MSNILWSGIPLPMSERRESPALPSGPNEALLFRDADYGALAVIKMPKGRLATIDHNFAEADFAPVLAVLERLGGRTHTTETPGVMLWTHFKEHPLTVHTTVVETLKRLGYDADPLGARVMRPCTEEEARLPDLPAESKKYQVRETVERTLKRHVEIAWSVLETLGKLSVAEVVFHPRENRRDGFKRPLPFLRARAFLAAEDAARVQKELRETLAVVGHALARATVTAFPNRPILVVEFALAPSAEMVEAILSEALPTFSQSAINGSRSVKFYLRAALPEAVRKHIAAQALESTAALAVESADGRTVTVRIPSAQIMDSASDTAFRDRLNWLASKFEAYEAEVTEIGHVEELARRRENARSESSVSLQPGVTEDREVYGSGGIVPSARPVSPSELKTLERFLNALFQKAGLEIAFTNHFLDRLNDPRNGRQITTLELAKVFKETYAKHSKEIRAHGADWEALIKDVTTAINIPFVLNYDRQTGDMDLVAKTIMRKPNFMSSDPKLVVATETKARALG